MKQKEKVKPNKIFVYIIIGLVALLIASSLFIFYLLSKTLTIESEMDETNAISSQKLLEVSNPVFGDRITSPVRVSGKANFFEGTVQIRVRDGNGKILGETFTTAEGSMDKLYPFSKSVEFEYPLTLDGTVEVFEISPKDGAEINKETIKIWFDYPAGGQGASHNLKQVSYQNSNPKYSFKYNSDWSVDSSKAERSANNGQMLSLTLSKKDHHFKVQMPSVWGPGACLYSDSPVSEGEIPIASQVAGDYVEVTKAGRVFRRAKDPQISNGRATWIVCQKGTDGLFSNATILQVISYEAPENYNSSIIKEMDDILKTINLP